MSLEKNDIGISPALLQAITQTLATTRGQGSEQSTRESLYQTESDRNTVIVASSSSGLSPSNFQSIQSNSSEKVVIIQEPSREPIESELAQHQSTFILYDDNRQSSDSLVCQNSEDNDVETQHENNELMPSPERNEEDTNDVIVQSGNNFYVIRQKAQDQTEAAVNCVGDNSSNVHRIVHGSENIIIAENNEQVRIAHGESGEQIIIVSQNPEEVITSEDIIATETVTVTNQSRDSPSIHYTTVRSETFEDGINPGWKNQFAGMGPCPICGDVISGYHYGNYTCESCKGFFKRTVQNKKAYSCHHNSECEINIMTRKKCPGCRFTRCLQAGMKTDAIRGNRQRGGRSSYDGCSPHGRPKSNTSSRKRPYVQKVNPATSVLDKEQSAQSKLPGQLQGQLARMLATQDKEDSNLRPLIVPKILLEIERFEHLLGDDDPPSDCCETKLSDMNQDSYHYSSLMHITEHRLYKVVKWARHLPEFIKFEIEDQINLLQHAWSELLCIGCVWRSVDCKGVVKISYGKTITTEQAKRLDMEDIISRMIQLSQHFQRLQVDIHEYVALKALILITPDVKDLKNSKIIRDCQEEIMEAFQSYALIRFPDQPTRFGEMILRLSEIHALCSLGKYQMMVKAGAGEIPTFSLLMECLTGSGYDPKTRTDTSAVLDSTATSSSVLV